MKKIALIILAVFVLALTFQPVKGRNGYGRQQQPKY
jgi:hypothetical protein